MAARISVAHLTPVVARINVMHGLPRFPKFNTPGAFQLDFANDGVMLEQVSNTCGGVRNVLGCGHVPKPQLYILMQAYIAGFLDHKELQNG